MVVKNPFSMVGGATFNEPRTNRFLLWRKWDETKPVIAFVMLNPSVADEHILDPTVSKCVKWARDWGFGEMLVTNVNPFVSTDPEKVKGNIHDFHRNLAFITMARARAQTTVVAWGQNVGSQDNAFFIYLLKQVRDGPLWCLGKNKDGTPKHPLYLKNSTKLVEF